MKNMLAAALLAATSIAALGQTAAKSDKSSVDQTLMQLERDWGQATIKKDFAAIEKILASDWVGIDYDGAVINRAEALEHLKSGASSIQSEELSDMKVRVFGNTAVVTGTDTEKSTDRGKDSSGKYVWTDVFVLRGGRWQVVASQSTRVR